MVAILNHSKPLRVFYVTSQWPTADNPSVAPFVKKETDALQAAGVELEIFVYQGGWSPFAYWRAIRELNRRIRANQFDVINARFGQCGLVARAQWLLPVVIMYGGSDIEGSPVFSGIYRFRNYILRSVSWFLSLMVNEVVVVSHHLGEKLPRNDFHVISSGVDMDLFRPIPKQEALAKTGLSPNKRHILFAGNPVNKRKRIELAQAACQLVQESFDVELVILTGQPQEKVPYYMNSCDLLLLTSTNEGSPNVIKEALACNLPIVTTDVGDVTERLANVDGCLVCETDDTETIAANIIQLLEREQRTTGRESIKGLDSQAMVQKLISVYEKAIQ